MKLKNHFILELNSEDEFQKAVAILVVGILKYISKTFEILFTNRKLQNFFHALNLVVLRSFEKWNLLVSFITSTTNIQLL